MLNCALVVDANEDEQLVVHLHWRDETNCNFVHRTTMIYLSCFYQRTEEKRKILKIRTITKKKNYHYCLFIFFDVHCSAFCLAEITC